MSRYTKAVVAVLTWVAVFLQALLTDPVFEEVVIDSNITTNEAWKLLFIALGAAGVYGFKNTPPAGEPRDPAVSEAAR